MTRSEHGALRLDVLDDRGRLGGAEFRVTVKFDFRDSLRLDDET